MCCGRGIRAAASRQYATPSTNTENGMKNKKPVQVPLFAWQQQPDIPDHPVPERQGAYYGNPVKETKATKKVEHPKKAEKVEEPEPKKKEKEGFFDKFKSKD